MNTLNNQETKTDPCGTPDVGMKIGDEIPL